MTVLANDTLVQVIYAEMLKRLGDEELAAVATAAALNEILARQDQPSETPDA